nr:nonstructural polyprotein [Hepelivirales sp.]
MTNVITPLRGDQIPTIRTEEAHNSLLHLVKDAVLVQFYTTTEQLEMIGRYFPNRVVKPGTNLTWNPHPVQATLNREAYNDINKTLKVNKGKQFNILEIGSAHRENTLATHHCIKIDDLRTKTRYTQTGTNQYLFKQNMTGLQLIEASNNRSNCLCTKGAQYCDYQAMVGYSVDVAYDIPFADNLKIMKKHGLNILYHYMFLPPDIMDTRLSYVTNSAYGVKYSEEKIYTGMIHKKTLSKFSYGDSSFMYIHDKKNLVDYMTNTVITDGEYAVTCEIDRSWGIYHRIKMVCHRTIKPTYYLGSLKTQPFYLERENVYQHVYQQWCIIPNLHMLVMMDYDKDMVDATLLVPRQFYDKAIGFCSRQDDNKFGFNAFIAFCQALVTTITFQNAVIWEGFVAALTLWPQIAISIFLIGAANRQDRSQIISSFFKEMKYNGHDVSKFFHEMFTHIKHVMNPFYDYNRIQKKLYGTDVDERLRNKEFRCLSALPLKPTISRGITFAPFTTARKYNHTIDYTYDYVKQSTDTVELIASNDTVSSDPNSKEPGGKPKKEIEYVKNHSEIYNPPADGKCGEHLLRYINKEHNISCDGDWMEIYDLIEELKIMKQNYVLHIYDKGKTGIISNKFNNNTKHVGILLKSGHYTLINCDCRCFNSVLCNYQDLEIEEDFVYCNAANEFRTDQDGQAKAFRKMFPTYNDAASKEPIVLDKQDGIKLAILNPLPNKNYKNNYATINKKLLEFAGENQIYMPFVGTGIFGLSHDYLKVFDDSRYIFVSNNEKDIDKLRFGTDQLTKEDQMLIDEANETIARLESQPDVELLDILTEDSTKTSIIKSNEQLESIMNIMDVKETISGMLDAIDDDLKCLQCNMIMTHMNQRAIDDHIRAHMRGGGLLCETTTPMKLGKVIANKELWESLPIERNYTDRVVNKIRNLFKSEDKTKSIVEMSYSPGHLAKWAEDSKLDYSGYHYTGKGALPIGYKCKNHYEYKSLANVMVKQQVCLIDIGDENTYRQEIGNYVKFINNNNGVEVFIIKMFAFQHEATKELINCFNYLNATISIIKPDESRISSSEFYVRIERTSEVVDDAVNDITPVIEEIINPTRDTNRGVLSFNVNYAHLMNYRNSLDVTSGIHTPIIEYIDTLLDTPDYNVNCYVKSGCAGCGKTRDIKLKNVDAYVAPLNRVTGTFNEGDGKKYTHEVFLLKLLEGAAFDEVYIDEYTLFPKGYFYVLSSIAAIGSITLMGDPYQIMLKNFSKSFTSDDLMSYKIPWQNNKTLRFGQTTCRLLNHMCKGHFPCDIVSDKVDKVTFDVVDNLKGMQHYAKKNKYHFISLEQKTKEAFRSEHHLASTIHESQGSTYDKVILYINGDLIKHNLIEDFEYTYVAMSRHREELKIITTSDDEVGKRFLNYMGGVIDVQLQLASVNTFSDLYMKPTKDVLDTALDMAEDNYSVDVSTVEEILTKHGLSAEGEMIIEARDAALPNIPKFNFAGQRNKAKIRISNGYIIQPRIQKYGHRLANKAYVRYYNIKDKLKTLQTGITRYAQLADHRKEKAFKLLFGPINILQKGFVKFTKFHTIEEYYEAMSPSLEQLNYHANEYIKSLNEKSFDAKTWNSIKHLASDYKMAIESFMKDQPKFQSTPIKGAKLYEHSDKTGMQYKVGDLVNYLNNFKRGEGEAAPLPFKETYKAGQGVTSWNRYLTLFFAAYTRHVNQELNKIMATVETKGFTAIYATNESDMNIGQRFAKNIGSYINAGGYKHLCTDFSEHDTSHSLLVLLWKCADYIGMGVDLVVVQQYFDTYMTWRQTNKKDGEQFTIYNDLMQHSGSSDTIHGNSKLTMGANGACFKFKDLKFAAFKGDDTYILARAWSKVNSWDAGSLSLIASVGGKDLASLLGFNLKIDETPVGEFICNFVTPTGFFPDLLRRVSRIVSNIHSSDEKFDEAKLNLAECLTVVRDQFSLNIGLEYARTYYNHNGINITADELYTLWKYANNLIKDSKLGPKQDYIIETFDSAELAYDTIRLENKYIQ